ncbi:protein adenylyltransferase SelO family protein [Sphingomonas bacterium]|uniref:protein adenylyltransferase SelO family protein n=1 Tax=Sphingomonas bacterium TaxID=1895847 RepID=UPI001576A877|nr:YdiU family protein [Sphingomonas bacterium]
MPFSPQAYRPAAALLSLGQGFYDPVEAADFPQARLRFRNDCAAAEVGLSELTDDEWCAHFGRFVAMPGTLPQPLALRYHGHQFRHYNPEIGDGRGFTFAQLRDARGRLMDLGTKGSGTTPWSRFGDGRLTLKGGVREVLASEMLEALNVATSRSFSLIETGEALHRGDEPSPTRSAVLVRLSHGHVRIGSFQRLAYLRDEAGLRALTGYVLRELYGEDSDDPIRLLDLVVARTATLAAGYMAAGFVHGVLNSDNINVTGESFDYGPWRFAPTWDPGFVAAYFDEGGLYAFGRQPEAIHWDVMQLAASLRLIADSEPLIAALERFAERYQPAIAAAMLWRLGVTPRGPAEDRALVQVVERAMRRTGVALERFFWDAFGGTLPASYADDWEEVRAALASYQPRTSRNHPYWQGGPCSMLIDEVEAIWAAIDRDDDWGPFDAKVAAIRAMGQALA